MPFPKSVPVFLQPMEDVSYIDLLSTHKKGAKSGLCASLLSSLHSFFLKYESGSFQFQTSSFMQSLLIKPEIPELCGISRNHMRSLVNL